MIKYQEISRAPIKIEGYLPKFTVEEPRSPAPIAVESPVIDTPSITEDTSSEPEQTTHDPIQNTTPSYTGSRFNAFRTAYDKVGADPKKFSFFAKLASKESGFDPYIQNKLGAPAYGYFQFMEGSANGRRWDNITRFANSDIETFRNSPELQIKAAQRLADSFLKGFSQEDIKKARELGYSDSALVAGAWLGGVGGVRKLLHKGISVDDKSWSKNRSSGTDMRTRMKEFNNLFKKGGVLKFQAGGTGELRPDNRSWLKKKLDYINTKYNSSKWASSAPATVLADFTPFGLFHYTAQGDPDTAKLAILPGAAGIIKAEKIAEPTAKAVKEGLETVYNHYGDNVAKYFQGSLDNLRNPDITLTLEERLKVPKKLENIEIADDLRHEYSFFTNNTGIPTLKVSSTATNPKYVGEKAAAKQFLQELVGTTSNNGIKSMTIPEKELFARRYGPTTTSTLSEKDIYARLMAYKAETGITSSFEKLTEKEAKELFNKAYNSNLFHSQGECEKFWEANKDKIISIFRRVPALLGAGLVGNEIIKSKKGSNTKNWTSRGVLKNEYNNPEEYYDYSNGEYNPSTDHWLSREPKTGLVLKNPNHPTVFMSYDSDSNLGYNWYKGYDGRIYSKQPWENVTDLFTSKTKIDRDEINHPVSIKEFKNVKAVYNYLLGLGANRKQAAGLTGVFIQESGLKHNNVSPAGAEGIAQLKGDKLNSYKKWLGDRPNTWQNQLTWLWDHINNGDDDWQIYYNNLKNKDPKLMSDKERKDWKYMKDSKWVNYSYKNLRNSWKDINDPGDIAELFTWTFERPTEQEAKISQRRDYAQQVYNLLNN